ncbi:MAG: hypothetical protein ACD_31C00005G0030 [uncultured bacterium]|uniref:ArnT-like N-terminal domain-containing protein n=2 Tax=Candidatus Daviesiibacteriota TaxID=1752718 RepID=A0A1F5IND1_9BACT|nr:MAG: hypothetical protein ACD_31C00005G0030 [uncultured bacterium]KKQ15735.1 MAG: hypothetical protein US28_C0011G0031 [Candidatus Daviesbacteria bacterium GW2011_GWA1_36_8]OGE17847.1 MAG: hypothetical protein A2858_03830 [Candidatus Daviesbacteria bacterium RIFCSPHIGHO2_01_FULL_36_37]
MKSNRVLLNLKKYVYNNKLLVIILILAGFLRVLGIYPGYHPYHSDEGMSYAAAINMIKTLSLDPGRYDYPIIIPLIHAIIYILILPFILIFSFIFSPDTLPSFKNILELPERFLVVNQQTIVLFWGRLITAFFGIGIVYLIYRLSINCFNDKKIALGAAFLTAVNYRQVLNSHLALPDIYNAFMLLLSLAFIWNLYKNDSIKNYFLAILFSVLSFFTKFQIFVFIPLTLMTIILSYKSSNIFQYLIQKKIIQIVLICLLVITLLHLYFFIHWEEFRSITSYVYLKYTFGLNRLNYYSVSYLYHVGIGPIIAIFSVLGMVLGLIKSFLPSFILLSASLPFLYLFLYYSGAGFYTRNFITVTPIVLIFAAFFIVKILNFIYKKNNLTKNLILGLIFLLISYSNFYNSYVLSYNYLKPWGFEMARNFAKANIPEGSEILSHPWDAYPRDKNFEVTPFESNNIFTINELMDEGIEYAFINLDWLSIKSNWWINRDPPTFLGFWEKPILLLKNTNSSAISQELASYTIGAFVKDWQAPEMNIVVIKVPKKISVRNKEIIKEFRFDNEEELNRWYLADSDINPSGKLEFAKEEGYVSDGSLKLDNRVGLFQSKRATSELIEIKSNRAYVIEGLIKSQVPIEKKSRDGMFRVDFYDKNPGKITTQTSHIYSSVSSRYFGEGWKKIEFVVIPPDNAKFMTINLEQIGNAEFLFFDDITVSESTEEFDNPRKKPPYIDYQIPDDILFPYSQGGL